MCTPSEENVEPTGYPFFSCTAAESSGEMQPANNGQMGAGANGTEENERGAKVLDISMSCCEL